MSQNTIFIPNIVKKKKLIGLIHKIYCSELKTFKKYLASTKTKGEVRGGGRKPWKQKGTGNARSGSIRSSIWVGGGVSFGPRPKVVKKKVNKKEKAQAIYGCFLLKKEIFHFLSTEDNLYLSNISKTKDFLTFLNNFLLQSNKNILIILEKPSKKLYLATRNIRTVNITLFSSLNLQKLLLANQILLSKDCFLRIKEIYGKKYI